MFSTDGKTLEETYREHGLTLPNGNSLNPVTVRDSTKPITTEATPKKIKYGYSPIKRFHM